MIPLSVSVIALISYERCCYSRHTRGPPACLVCCCLRGRVRSPSRPAAQRGPVLFHAGVAAAGRLDLVRPSECSSVCFSFWSPCVSAVRRPFPPCFYSMVTCDSWMVDSRLLSKTVHVYMRRADHTRKMTRSVHTVLMKSDGKSPFSADKQLQLLTYTWTKRHIVSY